MAARSRQHLERIHFMDKKQHIRKRLAEISAEAAACGATLDVSEDTFHDDKHLNCFWYAGRIGRIIFPDGWKVIVEVKGRVALYGRKNGMAFEYENDGSTGVMGQDIMKTIADDDELDRLAFSEDKYSRPDHAEFDRNNAIFFNYETPEGKYLDISGWCGDAHDDDNVLESFADVADFRPALDKFIADYANGAFKAVRHSKDNKPRKALSGIRELRETEISFSDEITEIDGLLNFYMDSFDGFDAVFGTGLYNTGAGDYINIYANYDLYAGRLVPELDITVCLADGNFEYYCYPLTPHEIILLRSKMELYCRKSTGLRLAEYQQSFEAHENMDLETAISIFASIEASRTKHESWDKARRFALAALQKQAAVKPIFSKHPTNPADDEFLCPICGATLFWEYDYPYCECGQKIDWSDKRKYRPGMRR